MKIPPPPPKVKQKGDGNYFFTFVGKSFVHVILISVLGLLVYSNTFHAPFQWDEHTFIVDNPLIQDISYFLEPSKAEGFEYYSAFKSRYIGYLTFALNYRFHGTDVRGYHVFNITIHILNAMLVYFLVVLTFRTQFLSLRGTESRSNLIALFSALLFVSHPIQTEAVTYIFQRFVPLSAFFCLLSMVFYIKWRLSPSPNPLPRGEGARGRVLPLLLYLTSLLSAVLAMKTKENAFTLPIVITLYEFLFFKGSLGKKILYLIPLLLTMLIIPLTLVGIDKPVGEIIEAVDSVAGIRAENWVYLYTEFRVIVTYIRLLFFPVNQNIYYDYPIYHSFLNLEVVLSFVFLLFIFAFAVYLIASSRRSDKRLIGFGILWFFIALSVESSIISLPMVINEYRLYLPSVGVLIAIASAASLLVERLRHKKIRVPVFSFFGLIVLVLSLAGYARNEAIRHYLNALKLKPDYHDARKLLNEIK
ncbi:MAG: hypothetical protein HY805_03955 [Nitrospirae bacterium]|nr:hypothetical protein [Nitrospirota bacterium]